MMLRSMTMLLNGYERLCRRYNGREVVSMCVDAKVKCCCVGGAKTFKSWV